MNYKLRDWLFARQRYWGEPFPLVYPEGSSDPVALPESELPVLLPETNDFRPSGTLESPLANVSHWVNTSDPRTGAMWLCLLPNIRERPYVPELYVCDLVRASTFA